MKYHLMSIMLLFPLIVISQSIVFTPTVKMEVAEVSLEHVTKDKTGYYGATPGYKYLVLSGTLYTKARRRIEFPVYKLHLKTNDSTYMALHTASYVPFSEKDRYILFKKKAKKKIFFEVDENFKEGIIAYSGLILGTIKMSDEVNAEFIAKENDN